MSVHRIRIHADRDGHPIAVDVALPSAVPVGELLPAVLDLVDDRTPVEVMARGWRLDRPAGSTLLESLSLADNDVRDGDLLVLAPDEAPSLGLLHLEPCGQVAAAPSAVSSDGAWLPGAVCILAATVAAVALGYNGVGSPSPVNLIVAAVGACAATAAALVLRHPAAPGVAAVVLASATGFLAVPSGPATPNAFLAAAVAAAVSLLLLRFSAHPSPAWWGTATVSTTIAVATAWTMPVVAAGAVLATASLGVLALAPRIAVLVAGLGPQHWTEAVDVRALTGHAALTGLVAGCVASSSAGAMLVAYAGFRWSDSPAGTVAFPALVGLVLLLRARTHGEQARQMALISAGLVSVTAAVVVAATAYAAWVGGALIALAVCAGRRPRTGPGVSRAADRLEYVALAAVVPTALWAGGAFTLIGGVRLS